MVSTNALVKVMARQKKIKITLSEKSINEALNQVRQYKASLLQKISVFLDRLTQVGIDVVDTKMMEVAPVDRGEFSVEGSVTSVFSADGSAVQGALIRLTGDQVLFIEFSAGKTFGTNSFPSMPNNPSYGSGYGMGTYPGKGHWDDPTGWWYVDRYGEAQHTYGIRAHAPMYHADQEMRRQIGGIAKEVFEV